MTRRFVLTGAPGSGKTTLIRELAARGHVVVAEAATDVITMQQSAGVTEPWTRPGFVDRVVAVQRERRLADVEADVQFLDRSPLCSVALARFLGRPVSAAAQVEVDAFLDDPTVVRTVFLVAPIGPIERTAARRISDADAVVFAAVHVDVYREHGFDLGDVPAGEVDARADLVEAVMRRAAAGEPLWRPPQPDPAASAGPGNSPARES